MPVAIDVNIGCSSCSYLTLKLCLSQISGDGQLPTSAAIPGSKANTRFDSLEIYLISYANSLNLTIAGPDANLFVQEPDSTVKHINYNISSCVPSGQYNVRFIPFHSFIHNSYLCRFVPQFSLYEISHFSDQQYFIISNIPYVYHCTITHL